MAKTIYELVIKAFKLNPDLISSEYCKLFLTII